MNKTDQLKIEYPPELKMRINDGTVIPLFVPSAYENVNQRGVCPNCGGLSFLMVYEPKPGAKPMRYPPANETSSWVEVGLIGNEHAGWLAGKTISGECPACSKGSTKAWLEKRCGLEKDELFISLESFHVDGQLSGKQPARDLALKLLAANSDAHGFVTFWGAFGCGKTHILMSLVNGFRGIGLRSVYATAGRFLEDIRARFGVPEGNREIANIIEYYREIRVLCLDEIDKVNLIPWTQEVIFNLINDRYTRKDRLLTVFASNKAPAELPVELGYMASRFTEGAIVEVPGPDMRPAIGEIQEDWTDR